MDTMSVTDTAEYSMWTLPEEKRTKLKSAESKTTLTKQQLSEIQIIVEEKQSEIVAAGYMAKVSPKVMKAPV